mgnify:CR=1 FL=1|tara:strand:- start:39 stop:281 length:243 start_codon:yes stop_codon:yes gene_type:complete
MTLKQAIQEALRISLNVYFGEESIPLEISKAKANQLMREASDASKTNYLNQRFCDQGCIYHAQSGAIIALLVGKVLFLGV